jgi:hypothetical protein
MAVAVAEAPTSRARGGAPDRSGSQLHSLDFGNVSVGGRLDKELTVHNLGTGNLTVTNITSTNDSFSVVPPVCPPDGEAVCFMVAPGGQRSVTVRFRPATVGSQEGELHIASNDLDAGLVRITLRGGGVAPNIRVDPDRLAFGPVDVGQRLDKELTVYNDGTDAFAVTTLTSPAPHFSVVSPAGPFTVGPGGQQPVTVRFSPATADAQSGELSLTSNDPDAATVTVPLQGVGRGVPNISVTPTLLNFGDVVLGQSVTRELTVHNTGTTDLDVTSIRIPYPGLNFSVDPPPGSFTVAPGGQRNVTVRFSPTWTGSYGHVLYIASNDPDAATVTVQLQGIVNSK